VSGSPAEANAGLSTSGSNHPPGGAPTIVDRHSLADTSLDDVLAIASVVRRVWQDGRR
jgi:hypothetical protein